MEVCLAEEKERDSEVGTTACAQVQVFVKSQAPFREHEKESCDPSNGSVGRWFQSEDGRSVVVGCFRCLQTEEFKLKSVGSGEPLKDVKQGTELCFGRK